jgi:hypothetical protein
MRMVLVDRNKKELMNFAVEIDKHMFIYKGLATHEQFKYLENRIMRRRKEHMTAYLNKQEYDNTKEGYKELENKLVNEMKEMLEQEIQYYNETLGINLYLVELMSDFEDIMEEED